MIYVDFLTTVSGLSTDKGLVVGFRVAGHSGMGETGTDIVCAAVSSAVYMAINTITDVLMVSPLSLRAEEGEAFFRIEERDELHCRSIISGLKLHLLGLEEQYPENLKVSYLEI